MRFSKNGLKNIVGLNRRNLEIISVHNKRKHFPIVDNKLKTKEYLKRGQIPCPETICVIRNFFEIERSMTSLLSYETFVVKPSRGSAGGGILLLEQTENDYWQTPSGTKVSRDDLKKHLSDILFGVYSFGLSGDSAIIEKRVYPHKVFTEIYPEGVADLRIITFHNKPLMAMLRIPTEQSDGKANLHQGAIGIPVDLQSGITGNAMIKGKLMEFHPDSHVLLKGRTIPFWEQIIQWSIKSSELIPLGYIGIDFVIDKTLGPLILELNARPGLQIQVINQRGLSPLVFPEDWND